MQVDNIVILEYNIRIPQPWRTYYFGEENMPNGSRRTMSRFDLHRARECFGHFTDEMAESAIDHIVKNWSMSSHGLSFQLDLDSYPTNDHGFRDMKSVVELVSSDDQSKQAAENLLAIRIAFINDVPLTKVICLLSPEGVNIRYFL